MNRQFIYLNDKVIVSNDSGIKQPIEYSDNIEDILVTENLIEKIKYKLDYIQVDLDEKRRRQKGAKYFSIKPI